MLITGSFTEINVLFGEPFSSIDLWLHCTNQSINLSIYQYFCTALLQLIFSLMPPCVYAQLNIHLFRSLANCPRQGYMEDYSKQWGGSRVETVIAKCLCFCRRDDKVAMTTRAQFGASNNNFNCYIYADVRDACRTFTMNACRVLLRVFLQDCYTAP